MHDYPFTQQYQGRVPNVDTTCAGGRTIDYGLTKNGASRVTSEAKPMYGAPISPHIPVWALISFREEDMRVRQVIKASSLPEVNGPLLPMWDYNKAAHFLFTNAKELRKRVLNTLMRNKRHT